MQGAKNSIHILALSLLLFVRKSFAGLEVASLLKGPCTVVAYGLGNSALQDLNKNIESLQLTLNSPTMAITDGKGLILQPLIKSSPCLTGLSDIHHHGFLQRLLYPTRRRNLIVVNDNFTDNTISKVIQVHKNHHPTTVITRNKSTSRELKQIACHDARVKTSNVFNIKNAEWLTEEALTDQLENERLCNRGQHPLFGKKIKASVYGMSPFVRVDKNLKLQGGVTIDMFKVLAKFLNFDYELFYNRNMWYNFYPNKTVGGTMGDVIYGIADVSLEQRTAIAYYFGEMTTGTYFDYSIFMEMAPKETPKYANIMLPFDRWTWMWLTISLFALAFALYLTNFLSNASQDMTFIQTLQMSFGIIFQECSQGAVYNKFTKFVQLRMMWVLVTMLITMAFVSNLKSSLVRKSFEERTMTVDEIVDKDMIVHTTVNTINYYKSRGDQLDRLSKRLLCQAEKKNSVFSIKNPDTLNEQMIDMLLEQGGTIGLLEIPAEDLRTTFLKNGTDFPFVIIPQKRQYLESGMFFQKYNPQAGYFNDKLNLMMDTGITDYLFRRALPYRGMKPYLQLREEKLVLEHFYIPLMIFLGGTVAGILTLMFEAYLKNHTD